MAMYLSMTAENGEVVFSNARWLPSQVWDEIIKEKGDQELHPEYEEMQMCKDYYVDIQDIPRAIEYYQNLIEGKFDDGFGMISLIRHRIIPALKRQLDYQVSEHRTYILRWD